MSIYRVSIHALIKDNKGRFLMVSDGNSWDFPGGGMEYGETPHQTLIREINEELSIEVSSISAKPVLIHPVEDKGKEGANRWQLTIYYWVDLNQEKIDLNKPAKAFDYMQLSRLEAEDKIHQNRKGILDRIQQVLND